MGEYFSSLLAHEMSSHDTKEARKKGLSLVQLLDRAARGDKKSSAEWLRAIEALQGRRRFHAGDISSKLGIPTCSEWEDEEHQAELMEHNANAPEPVKITYSLRDHLRATAIDHPRFGSALILRAARGGDAEKVWSMVKKLCDEYDTFKRSQAITPEQQIEERLFAEVGKDLNFD